MQRFAVTSGAVFISFMFLGQASAAGLCPMIFAPVCAIKHGKERTYSNACVARNAHARVIYRGRCRMH